MDVDVSLTNQPYLSPDRRHNNERLWSRYMEGREMIGLNIGCGTALKQSFLNCDLHPPYDDVFALDVTYPFPWESDSLDYVFSEHMIEHVGYGSGRYMLQECFRVLRPGGRIRVVTPGIEFLMDLFQPAPEPLVQDYIVWAQKAMTPDAPAPLASFVFNTFVRSWGHTFIYDRPTLRLLLEDVGFERVQECKISVSQDEFLSNLEAVHRMPAGYLELESIIFEGQKRA